MLCEWFSDEIVVDDGGEVEAREYAEESKNYSGKELGNCEEHDGLGKRAFSLATNIKILGWIYNSVVEFSK